MLSGKFEYLVDNMWLTDILSVILIIIPLFLIFFEKKYIFTYYTISIVANLPLIFQMSFGFSYEAIIIGVILISIAKDAITQRTLRYITTKQRIQFIVFLIVVLLVNLLTSLVNFNRDAFIERLIIYTVNLFILFVFNYFLISKDRLDAVKNGFLIGALVLVISMLTELIYGYYVLNVHNMRPAGLLLDPNVCAFALNLCLIVSFYPTKNITILKNAFIIAVRVLILFGIFLTVSRSAYISTVIILFIFLIYYSKGKTKWVASTTVLVFVIMYFLFYGIITDFIRRIYGIIDLDRVFPTNLITPPRTGTPVQGGGFEEPDYSNSRMLLISSAFEIFKNNFVAGVGIGNVTTEIDSVSGLPMNSHNLFLQLLAESGILILFAILLLCYYAIMLIVSAKSRSRFFFIVMAIIFLVESLFNHNILNINIIWLILSFFLSVSVIYAKEQKVFIINRNFFQRRHHRR